MGDVFNLAVNVAETGSAKTTYLYQFPNNIGIALVYIVLFKIFKLVGITDYLSVAVLFNSCIVGISAILMYLITKKLFGNKKALMLLIILLLTTPFYLYTAIYYTDTLSMFMILLIAYTYIVVKNIKKENNIQKIIGYVMLTLFVFIGIKIKITTIFIVIAYLIYAILNGEAKSEIRFLIIIIPTFIILTVIYNIVINNTILKNKEITNQVKLPIEQWIVMGLKENGGFDQYEYEYMSKFQTYDEKKNAARQQIKEELMSYDANSFIKHLNSKLKYAWTDGTYFAPEKLRREPVNNTIIHEFVLASGKYSQYYKYIPQVMHMSMLIFIFLAICATIKENNFYDKNVIFFILMLGFIVFFLIWENRSRYILTCVPFLMIAQLKGIELCAKYKEEKLKKEKR